MIIYHGSTVRVEQPRILAGFRLLDFGPGFYTTSSCDQALRWARTKMRRERQAIGYVSAYELDMEAARQNIRIRTFDCADEQWLQFVVNNRRGVFEADPADLYCGPVADDSVYATIRLFETDVLNEAETIRRLKTEALHDQITFRTESALSFCHFIRADEIREA